MTAPIRIAIDAITPGASLESGAGGMRMYVTTLTARMSELEPEAEFVVLESRQFQLDDIRIGPNVRRVLCPGVPMSRVGRIAYQNSVLPAYMKRLQVDALLATCNVLPLGCPVPAAVVVQSLQYFDYPKAYGAFRGAYLRAALKHASRKAKALICVSEAERRDLIRLTRVDPKKVTVIHHGVPPAIAAYDGLVRPAMPPYILCVATLYRYKNLERLIEAFARFRRQTAMPHRLKIVGGEADVTIADLALVAERAGVTDHVEFTGPLSQDRITLAYAGASAFVYPSLAETFGLPPLEAMTMGIPVVASNAGPIPEIVGEGAELVDPCDVDDIARGLGRVLLDPQRTESLVRMGRKRARDFSWDESARRTFDTVRSVVG